MITKIWGPGCWISNHCITFGYPTNPTENDKKNYIDFFRLLGDVLPCKYCRDSYKQFINEDDTKLTMDVMENRDKLTKWFYDIHNKVNQKLGVDYGITYDDVVKKYEAFRATCNTGKNAKGCVKPLRGDSYKIANYKECHIIPIDTVKKYVRYARKRNLPEIDFLFLAKYNSNKKLREKKCDANCTEWINRNAECRKIIDYMRINNIPSLETDGEYKGLPTYYELQLILRMCSNMNNDELLNVAKKL